MSNLLKVTPHQGRPLRRLPNPTIARAIHGTPPVKEETAGTVIAVKREATPMETLNKNKKREVISIDDSEDEAAVPKKQMKAVIGGHALARNATPGPSNTAAFDSDDEFYIIEAKVIKRPKAHTPGAKQPTPPPEENLNPPLPELPHLNLEQEIACDICYHAFIEPVTTQCGHSFCDQCLEDHLALTAETCPTCRFKVSPFIKTKNFTLAAIVDKVVAQEQLALVSKGRPEDAKSADRERKDQIQNHAERKEARPQPPPRPDRHGHRARHAVPNGIVGPDFPRALAAIRNHRRLVAADPPRPPRNARPRSPSPDRRRNRSVSPPPFNNPFDVPGAAAGNRPRFRSASPDLDAPVPPLLFNDPRRRVAQAEHDGGRGVGAGAINAGRNRIAAHELHRAARDMGMDVERLLRLMHG